MGGKIRGSFVPLAQKWGFLFRVQRGATDICSAGGWNIRAVPLKIANVV